MYKHLISIVTLSVVTSSALADTQPANYQESASTAETTGFFSGMVLGGLAGGPPGIILGAAIGSFLGDGIEAKQRVGDLQADVFTAQLQVAAAREQMAQLQRDYQLAQAELDQLRTAGPQMIAATASRLAPACCDNTALSVHFRTGSSAIESHYEEQLASIVRLARQMPAANVEIIGYADRNGDAQANLELSRQRSAAVREFFNRSGIENSSITTVAYGESKPVDSTQTFESDFFDRRVIVKLHDASQSMLTQSADGQ